MWSQTAGIHSIKPSLKIDSRPAPRPADRRLPAWSAALGRARLSPAGPRPCWLSPANLRLFQPPARPALPRLRSLWAAPGAGRATRAAAGSILRDPLHPDRSLRVDVVPRGARPPFAPNPALQQSPTSPATSLLRLQHQAMSYPKIPMVVTGRARDTWKYQCLGDPSFPSVACIERPSRIKMGQRLHLCLINLSCSKLKHKLNISIS